MQCSHTMILMPPVADLHAFARSQGIPDRDLPVHVPAVGRRLPLEGAYNFRDIGGYRTSDGRHVASGRVFRSDHLNELTDSDRKMIRALNIVAAYDFRLASEIERQPSRWFNAEEPNRFPVVQLSVGDLGIDESIIDTVRDMMAGKITPPPATFWDENYLDIVVRARPMFTALLRGLSEDGTPAVFHCTGGKDRTGVSAALLLSILGVDRDIILDDFLLTNLYRTPFRLQTLRPGFVEADIDIDAVVPIIGVSRSALVGALNSIELDHGGVEQYLIDGGLSPAHIDNLRATLVR